MKLIMTNYPGKYKSHYALKRKSRHMHKPGLLGPGFSLNDYWFLLNIKHSAIVDDELAIKDLMFRKQS